MHSLEFALILDLKNDQYFNHPGIRQILTPNGVGRLCLSDGWFLGRYLRSIGAYDSALFLCMSKAS